MRNKIYLATLFILFIKVSFSQTKTYSGEYENGIATYQYYENSDFERVLNGTFSYKVTDRREGRGYCTIEVSGRFKDNIKDGKWTYKVISLDKKDGTT